MTKTWLVEQLLERVVRLQVISKSGNDSVSAYVYSEGRDSHINDQIYEQFALEEAEVEEVTTDAISLPEVTTGETLPSICIGLGEHSVRGSITK